MLGKVVTRSQARNRDNSENSRPNKKRREVVEQEQEQEEVLVEVEVGSHEEQQQEEVNLLDGLNLTKNGQYVKVDHNLFNRLKRLEEDGQGEQQEPIIRSNPFEDTPEFLETIRNGTPLTLDFLQQCSDERKLNPDAVKMGEMCANIPLDWLALKRTATTEDNWDYSVKVSGNPRVTNQYNSGRCWAYSALNFCRRLLMKKLNIENKFELSESYLYFYDKIERSNLFLEYMWTFRNHSLEDRIVRNFTSPSGHMLNDGGYFSYFVNLIQKYGIVPKNIYGETYNTMVSGQMNETLITVLNHMALEVFRNGDIWSREDFEIKKSEYMKTIHDLVVRFLGEPPKPDDKFTWTYKDDHEEMHSVPNCTAKKFYSVIIPHEFDTKMVIINDPRHPETYYMKSLASYSTNMQGGAPVTMINLPMDDFKKIICNSLKNDESVWFASDISKCFDFESKTSDPNRFNYKSVLGTDVEFEKGDMLDMLSANPNHALLLCGVDTVQDAEGNVLSYTKWRTENSWGEKCSPEWEEDHGNYRMTDAYMDKYVYEAAVDLKYFEQDVLEKILNNTKSGKSFTYSPYDAFGTVARMSPCKHCLNHKRDKRPGFNCK